MSKKSQWDWVHYTPTQIKQSTQVYIRTVKTNKKKMLSIPVAQRTFENTVVFYIDKLEGDLGDFPTIVNLLSSVSPNKKIRDAASQSEVEIKHAMVDILHDPVIYNFFVETRIDTAVLSPESRKVYTELMTGFRRNGFDQPNAIQEKIKKLNKQLSELSNGFDKRLSEFSDSIWLSRAELDGLSDAYIAGLVVKDGLYKITADYPVAGPIMSYANNADVRRRVYALSGKKGGVENLRALSQMGNIRHSLARLLKYPHFAEYVISEKMAGSYVRVEKFVHKLRQALLRAMRFDLALIRDAQKIDGETGELEAHNMARYLRMVEEKYGVDGEAQEIKNYFPYAHVRDTMFQTFGTLLGFVVTPLDVSSWHDSVEVFLLTDTNTRESIGYLCLDLFPREGKYKHAAAFNVQTRNTVIGQLPVLAIVGNLTAPSATYPSLLSLGEVGTLFHEFGHAVHFLVSQRNGFRGNHGFATKLDFVEIPSQLFEEWVWQPAVLRKLTRHYITHAVMPAKLRKKIIESRFVLAAYYKTRQLMQSELDFHIHTQARTQKLNTFWQELLYVNMKIRTPKEHLFPANFGHLAHGYEAGYYSYLWSLSIAVDIFSEFERSGCFNRSAGKRLRVFLSAGAALPEMDLVTDFLGRSINDNRFVDRILNKQKV